MVSSKDVAKMAGVSVSTVSRVFSNSDLVNRETAQRVLDVAAKLHYVPNISARSLKLQRSDLLGVVLSDISNPFYIQVLKDVFDYSQGSYRFLVVFSEEDKEKEAEAIETLISSNVASLIFTPVAGSNPGITEALTNNGIPALQLYRNTYDNFDSLIIDDAYGAYLAARELIENGHRDIVLLDYDVEIPTHREEGYKRAFQEAGLTCREDHFIRINIREDVNAVIGKHLSEKNFTAVIPVSSILAHAAINYLHARSLRIGEDVSVIIYDDIPLAQLSGISVVSHPFDKLTTTISEMIQGQLDQPGRPAQHKELKPFLIRRSSVKRLIK